MAKKLYVGNLPYSCSESDLVNAFSVYGEIASARVVTDRQTGRSKGFGFVEMVEDSGANNAIQNLNGKSFMGRQLTVNEARPREERSFSSNPYNQRRQRGFDSSTRA
jgi:cold-inducible RNA-binding protein